MIVSNTGQYALTRCISACAVAFIAILGIWCCEASPADRTRTTGWADACER